MVKSAHVSISSGPDKIKGPGGTGVNGVSALVEETASGDRPLAERMRLPPLAVLREIVSPGTKAGDVPKVSLMMVLPCHTHVAPEPSLDDEMISEQEKLCAEMPARLVGWLKAISRPLPAVSNRADSNMGKVQYVYLTWALTALLARRPTETSTCSLPSTYEVPVFAGAVTVKFVRELSDETSVTDVAGTSSNMTESCSASFEASRIGNAAHNIAYGQHGKATLYMVSMVKQLCTWSAW
jgi:hypothetical protein